jgi:hypothetical protein
MLSSDDVELPLLGEDENSSRPGCTIIHIVSVLAIVAIIVGAILYVIFAQVHSDEETRAYRYDHWKSELARHDAISASCRKLLASRLTNNQTRPIPDCVPAELMWLRLCVVHGKYDPDTMPMSLEVFAWYFDAPDRSLLCLN